MPNDFPFPDIFTVFYGIAQSFFSFQNAVGFFLLRVRVKVLNFTQYGYVTTKRNCYKLPLKKHVPKTTN